MLSFSTWKMFRGSIVLLLVSLLLLLQSCNYCVASPYARDDVTKEVKFSSDNFMVHFDPRPSVDEDEDSQYNSQEENLISLVKLVSTRFNRLLIDPIWGGNINVSNITNAVAKYNNFHRSSKFGTPTQLWVYIPMQNYNAPFNNISISPTKYLENVRNTLEASNNIFPGSVEGLILDADHFLHPKNHSVVRANVTNIKRIFRNEAKASYKISIVFPKRNVFSNTTQRQMITEIITEIDACCVMTFVNPTADDIDSGVNATILKYQKIMEDTVKEIRSINGSRSTMPIFRTGYPDTSNNSKTKNRYGDLVHYWQSMNEWAVRTNTTVALTEAFDVPSRNSPASRSLGWWKAENDEENYDVIYKEKVDYFPDENAVISLMQPEVHKDKDEAYVWKDKHFNFQQNSRLSVHFNPHLPKTQEINSVLTAFLEKCSEKFGQLSFWDKDMGLDVFTKFPSVLAQWNNDRAKEGKKAITSSLTFSAPAKNSTGEERGHLITQIRELVDAANALHKNTVSTVLVTFHENFNTKNIKFYLGILALVSARLGSDTSYKFGVEIPLNVCRKKFDSIVQLLPFVKMVKLKHVNTDQEISSGVAQTIEKTTGIFEVCRKRIEKTENGTGASSGKEAVLGVGWQDTDEKGNRDYEDFVRFWGEMNTWAKKASASVVMMEAFDKAEAKESNNNKGKSRLGWWVVVKNDNTVRTGLDYDFIEKRKSLLNELPEQGNQVWENDNSNEEGNLNVTEIPEYSEGVTMSTKNTTITDDDKYDEEFWFWVNCLVPTGCAIVVSAILAVLLVWRLKRNQREMTKEEMREFLSGNSRFGDNLGEEQYINTKYNTELYEIPLQNIAFDSVVGYGKCAIVYKASLANTVVAVKVPKKDCSKQYYKSMLLELKIMANVGENVNVLSFHGANTKDVKKGMVYIITEYCGNGSLYAYLRTLRYNLDAAEDNSKKLDNIYELYKFAYEIACGMKYLSEKDIIHGDLSSSNILLNGENNVCKITNYGLSRKVDDSGEYLKRKDNSFPWRWIAVESLKHKIVTSKSDIWSYGVTLWEIFSLARIPYKGQAVQEGFLEKVEKGLRLKRPKYATQDVYDNMMQCWSKNPTDRPQFLEQAEYFLLLMKEELDHMDNKVGI